MNSIEIIRDPSTRDSGILSPQGVVEIELCGNLVLRRITPGRKTPRGEV
jgi:hypothetical protein